MRILQWGNTIDIVPSDTVIEEGKQVLLQDDEGNVYSRDDVYVAPFPANADKKFMKAASDLVNRKFSVSGSRYVNIKETDVIKKSDLMAEVSKEIDNRQKFIDVFDRTTEKEAVVGDTLIQRNFRYIPYKAPSEWFNAGAVHALGHVLECGLTYDDVIVNGEKKRVAKSPITAQELNDYLPLCLSEGKIKPGKYEGTYTRTYEMPNGKSMIAVVVQLDGKESARTGAKFGLITVMSNRHGYEIDWLIKTLADGKKVHKTPEGRTYQLPTGDSIPNYLNGFKGAPYQGRICLF